MGKHNEVTAWDVAKEWFVVLATAVVGVGFAGMVAVSLYAWLIR